MACRIERMWDACVCAVKRVCSVVAFGCDQCEIEDLHSVVVAAVWYSGNICSRASVRSALQSLKSTDIQSLLQPL